MELSRLEPPVLLEVILARATLAPSIVKQAIPAFAPHTHQFPVLEVVCRKVTSAFQVASVIGEDLIPEIERQHTADELALVEYGQDFAILAKYVLEQGKVTLW